MIIRAIFSGGSPFEILQAILFGVVAVILALSVHEFSHAFVAYKMGDGSQKYAGRMTLNPFKHVDPYGVILLLLFGFGWGRPVVVDPRNYKHPKLGSILVPLAGALANFLSGFIWLFLYGVCVYFAYDTGAAIFTNLTTLITYIVLYNISLGFFNLIPLPPLDGSKVVAEFLPYKYKYKYLALERYSMYFFIALIILLDRLDFLSPLVNMLISFYLSLILPILEAIFQ